MSHATVFWSKGWQKNKQKLMATTWENIVVNLSSTLNGPFYMSSACIDLSFIQCPLHIYINFASHITEYCHANKATTQTRHSCYNHLYVNLSFWTCIIYKRKKMAFQSAYYAPYHKFQLQNMHMTHTIYCGRVQLIIGDG